ncbi:MAG: response regulator transcription factor [Clostridia bacterium]|nr:response regulator transcription factor [Clostridia bacterium]
MDKIKIVLVDDHAVFRSGLAFLMNSQPDMEVIGEAASGEEAVRVCEELRPHVILLDLTMPGMGGLAAMQHVKALNPDIKILVLTMHDDEGYLRNVLQLGGAGYIVKKAAHTEVLAAVRQVYNGEIYIDPSLTKVLVQGLINPLKENRDYKKANDLLTERDEEILRFIALGYTNKQIADTLYISIKTVENNKARLKEKLNLQGRSELVRFAISKGLVGAENE